jgi:peptidoglycan/LPS O-acetylase OafA/YrhL
MPMATRKSNKERRGFFLTALAVLYIAMGITAFAALAMTLTQEDSNLLVRGVPFCYGGYCLLTGIWILKKKKWGVRLAWIHVTLAFIGLAIFFLYFICYQSSQSPQEEYGDLGADLLKVTMGLWAFYILIQAAPLSLPSARRNISKYFS